MTSLSYWKFLRAISIKYVYRQQILISFKSDTMIFQFANIWVFVFLYLSSIYQKALCEFIKIYPFNKNKQPCFHTECYLSLVWNSRISSINESEANILTLFFKFEQKACALNFSLKSKYFHYDYLMSKTGMAKKF